VVLGISGMDLLGPRTSEEARARNPAGLQSLPLPLIQNISGFLAMIPTTKLGIQIYECHARYEDEFNSDEFDDLLPYNEDCPQQFASDGCVSFMHSGGGKYGESLGEMTGWPSNSQMACQNTILRHEFWSTPCAVFADGPHGRLYIHGDKRIKGFDATTGVTTHIFNVKQQADNPVVAPGPQQGPAHSRPKLFRIGRKVYYLQRGVVSEWDLNVVPKHNGVRRFVSMSQIAEDLAQWPADQVIDESSGWMDDTVGAEVTIGVSSTAPSYVIPGGLYNPECVGMLCDGQMAWTYELNFNVALVDSELRQWGSLVGHADRGTHVVQRPMFADCTSVATSDEETAKVWDIRTCRPEVTVIGKTSSATPIDADGLPYLAISTSNGHGVQMWDMRQRRLLYALPSLGETAWHAESKRLICEDGKSWLFGATSPRPAPGDKNWEFVDTWRPLYSKQKDECCVM
jgi:hypothetical protein